MAWSEEFYVKDTRARMNLSNGWYMQYDPESERYKGRHKNGFRLAEKNISGLHQEVRDELLRVYKTLENKEEETNTMAAASDRLTNWQMYNLALTTPGVDRILVYGPPGVGKTHAACEYFQQNNIDFEQVTATEGDMVSEYRGMWVPAGEKFDWFHGLFVRAWTANNGEGMPVIVNEVDKFPMECMSIMHGILDNPNIASLTLPNGQRVKPGPKFRFIGTMNGVPADLSEALQTRFQVKINIDRPHQSAIDLLDEDIQKIAPELILAEDTNQRINFRQLLTFKEIRGQVGDKHAAQLVFGKRANDLLAAIKLG